MIEIRVALLNDEDEWPWVVRVPVQEIHTPNGPRLDIAAAAGEALGVFIRYVTIDADAIEQKIWTLENQKSDGLALFADGDAE